MSYCSYFTLYNTPLVYAQTHHTTNNMCDIHECRTFLQRVTYMSSQQCVWHKWVHTYVCVCVWLCIDKCVKDITKWCLKSCERSEEGHVEQENFGEKWGYNTNQ